MSGHVRDDELMDAAEGLASGEVRRHLQACSDCRARVEEAAGGWDLAREADVPEPSPLYWEAFRGKVRGRVAAERSWARTAWVPALAAATLTALAIGWLGTGRDAPVPAATLPAWSASLPADDELAALATLGDAADPAVLGCSGVSDCLSGLDEEETIALAEVLSEELGGDEL
jgi:hypothetical protein